MSAGASQRSERILIFVLLAVGVVYWMGIFGWGWVYRLLILAIVFAFVAAFLPSVGNRIWRSIEDMNAVLGARGVQTAAFVSIIATGYLLCYAWATRAMLFVKFNDEHGYIIQARMMARGRLWMPAYPADVSPFFNSLALITDRVYASMYFPGTALATVPFLWLGIPYWLMPLLSASIAVGLLYLLMSELFDPARGLLAALVAISLPLYRDVATFLLAEMPFLAAELVLLLAWFRLRRGRGMRWALIVGAAAGYCAITRPLDALCIALPVGIAIAVQFWGEPRLLLRAAGAVLVGASPFIALLLVQNKGITGQWFRFAESYYNEQNFPAPPLGFHQITPEMIPKNLNAAKQQWLHDWVLPMYRTHTLSAAMRTWYRGRLKVALENALPDPILLILLPVGLLSVRETRRVVLMAGLGLFFVGYAAYLFFLEHYLLGVLPAMICLLLMAPETTRRAWPGVHRVYVFVLLFIFTVSVTSLWPVEALPLVPPSAAADQRPANALLAHLPETPAVVLFRFDPMVTSAHDDPVYNDGVAWPDDAEVVRARDLGAEADRALYRYYAKRQPNRVFYIYDPRRRAEGKNPLIGPLGTAAELAAKSG